VIENFGARTFKSSKRLLKNYERIIINKRNPDIANEIIFKTIDIFRDFYKTLNFYLLNTFIMIHC
jgi:hypothetical protein